MLWDGCVCVCLLTHNECAEKEARGPWRFLAKEGGRWKGEPRTGLCLTLPREKLSLWSGGLEAVEGDREQKKPGP